MNDEFILIDSDAKKILDDALYYHEELTGEKLPLASEKTFIYSTVAAILANTKSEMNQVAIQNYLRYAKGQRLDLKGELYGVRGKRIESTYARATMRCYISTTVERDVIIPQGTRFIYSTHVFKSENEAVIFSGEEFTDIIVVSEISGAMPRILSGEINTIVDRYDFYQRCENISEVSGGADLEEDSRYRERLAEIPESFTTAGSEKGYEFWVKSVTPLIKDTYITSPQPCYIDIYILGENGKILSQEIEQQVLDKVNDKSIRPQGDIVSVKSPEIMEYQIDFTYYLYKKDEVRAFEIDRKLKESITAYARKLASMIGGSINTQDIIEIVKNCGAKRVEIISPVDIQILNIQVAVCTNISIKMGGVEER